MICKSCGFRNSDYYKFCVNCGEEFISAKYANHIFCPQCGIVNNRQNKFCISCGNELRKADRKHSGHSQTKPAVKLSKRENYKRAWSQRAGKQNSNGAKVFWVAMAIVMFAVLLPTTLFLVSESDKGNLTIPVEIKSNSPVIEAKVFEIASKFVCSCGTCNEESLELCSCGRAVEERQFIRDYLQQNQQPDNIVLAVANRYGFIKAEFASLYDIDPAKVWNAEDELLSKNTDPENPLMKKSTSQSKPWNTVCPVKGEVVDPAVTTIEYKGKSYGFCCIGCDIEFMKNPAKYSGQLNDDGTVFISG